MSANPNPSQSAADLLVQTIEERQTEWEREFGDEVDVRRTTAFEQKK